MADAKDAPAALSIEGVLKVFDPAPAGMMPVLVDSPHSGRAYPEDFRHACNRVLLERYEDRHVDRLIEAFPRLGATVVTAQAPRSYIDLNRAHDDFSSRQLNAPWDGPNILRPSDYSAHGIGLIWERVDGVALYRTPLSPGEVRARIRDYYEPYYAVLEDRAALLRARFGRFIHLNIHSMPPETQGDIVLGNLDGRSCSAETTRIVADAFARRGLRVRLNAPYKGARLTELFGLRGRGDESIQIEINKALYLKADLLAIDTPKFKRLQSVLNEVVLAVADYAADYATGPKTSSKDDLRAASRSAMETALP